MVGLNKMESKKYGKCALCSKNASTTCDRTGKHICTSCVTILVKGTQMQIRMKRV